MIRLILGRAGTGKTARVLREIADRVEKRQGANILLVPEQYSHEAERELCRAAGDALSLYGEVLSFTGLVRKMTAEFGGACPGMDRGGRLLCMAWAMDRLPPESLRLYRRGRKDVRVADSLVLAMEELKNAGIDAEKLLASAEDGELPGLLADKLRELALIMEAYETAQARSAADPSDALASLAERIAEEPAVRARAASLRFYVDGFSDFTELEKRLLRELIRAGASLTVCLTCPGDGARDDGDEMFALTGSTVRWLEDAAREADVPCVRESAEPEGGETPLRYLAGHLFDFSREPAPEAGGSIRLVTAADAYEECELAASRMAELARSGARWREMAVAVRGFGDYRTALESACIRYGVPLFLSGRGDMLQKSVPLLIASALEAVTRGYEYEAVFGYLKTGLAPIDLAACDELENYAVLWNIRGSMWERPFTMHPDGYNQPYDETTRPRLDRLNEYRERGIAPLKALENAMKDARDARGQARALADFLVAIDLPEKLAARAEELEASGRRETAAEYEQLWETVCAALEQFAAVLGDTPMDASDFRELFCRMLSKYDVSVIPVSLDRVQAGDFDGMRRRHIRHLFILGAADGRLPAPEETAGVFTPEEREELTARGFSLGGPEEDLIREFWRIYSCLSLPSDSLYMSWPRMSGAEGETRPSVVAERAMTLFGLAPERGDITRARTFSREAAYTLAVRAEAGDRSPVCAAALAYFREEGQGEALRALVREASAGRGRLGAEAVERLYGEKPVVTATRAQKFGDCRFAYFLQYGLKAKPRQRAVFDARDNGTFMHWILEKAAGEILERGGFDKVTEDEVGAIADRWVEEYIHRELNDFAEKSARFEYLFRRLRSTVRHVVTELWQELRDSSFRPAALELDLTAEGVLSPEAGESDLRFFGQIDRVDAWEHDDALYLRVVDYKTGQKKFKLSDICEGVNMQMLLYLFTLIKRGGDYFRELGFTATELRPAGVLYSPARFRVVRADGDSADKRAAQDRLAGVGAEGKRSGLVLDDPAVLEAMEPGEKKRFLPVTVKLDKDSGAFDYAGQLAKLEDFGALSRFIDGTLRDMAAQLRAGSVEADPWFESFRVNACVNCEFASACLFDEGIDGWRLRESLDTDEAWKKIRGNGDE